MYKSQPLRTLLPLLVFKYAAKGFGRFLQTALHALSRKHQQREDTMLRKIRIILGIICFAAITFMFLDFTGTLNIWFHWLAHIQFIPALLSLHVGILTFLILLTLIFGRIYCSTICPLGVMQDVIARIHNLRRKNRYTYSRPRNVLRYGLLILTIGAYAAGLTGIVALVAPYSSYGRMAANLLQPIYIFGNNILAAIAAHFDSYAFYSRDIIIKSNLTLGITLATFAAIFILAWRNGRTYCNTICPVGTILGLLSRFSWLKVHISDDKCAKCGLCAKNCKASCIDVESKSVDNSRCVACGNCIGVCRKNAIVYNHATKQHPTDKKETVDNGKRLFFIGSALAAASAAKAQKNKKLDGGLAPISKKIEPHRNTPITPPGSLSASNMARHCTSCQLCVSQCPNDVLIPSTDLAHLMQPRISYENGYCRPECTRCTEVCPTGAIRHLTKAEKSSTQIGHAVWIRKNCLPVTDGIMCGNCARHCPTGAIQMVSDNSRKDKHIMIPVVNEEKCIGCGACENLCPSRPYSAIYVEGHELHKTI